MPIWKIGKDSTLETPKSKTEIRGLKSPAPEDACQAVCFKLPYLNPLEKSWNQMKSKKRRKKDMAQWDPLGIPVSCLNGLC